MKELSESVEANEKGSKEEKRNRDPLSHTLLSLPLLLTAVGFLLLSPHSLSFHPRTEGPAGSPFQTLLLAPPSSSYVTSLSFSINLINRIAKTVATTISTISKRISPLPLAIINRQTWLTRRLFSWMMPR